MDKIFPITEKQAPLRKPEWMRVKIQGNQETEKVKQLLSDLQLHTVCLEANCPNRMECYSRSTATFMLLGNNCTRNCTFCNVTKLAPTPVDTDEPKRIGVAVRRLGLKHAVITAVTRDDLADGGAAHFAEVVREIRKTSPSTTIELLISDLAGNWEALKVIVDEKPDVLNHNVETVPELYSKVRPMAEFDRSVELLRQVKMVDPRMKTKSGIMLGLGETREQLIEALKALRAAKCDFLTLGQYLPPSPQHTPLIEYVTPQTFEELKVIALELGFENVASSPLVRSSYHADEMV